MSTFRIPSGLTEIVQILGAVLRNHLRFEILIHECWTFKFPEPTGNSDLDKGHNCFWQTHFAEGNFTAKIAEEDRAEGKAEDTVQIRVKGKQFHGNDLKNDWEFAIWLKLPNGRIQKHHFVKSRSDTTPKQIEIVAELPPNEISFR